MSIISEPRRDVTSDLLRIANAWGYSYEILTVDGAAAPKHDVPLVEGNLITGTLARGLRICTSELLSTCDNERSANLTKSLTLILALDGSPLNYRLGTQRSLRLDPGHIATLAIGDGASLSAQYRRGDCTRLVALEVSPESLDDEDLSEIIHAGLARNVMAGSPISWRAQGLARELFSPRYVGVAGRLLAESYALEILADCIAADERLAYDTGTKAGDVAKMLRIRDLLLSDLGASYSLSGLAREAGVSATILKAKFRAVVGQSPFEFLRERRLERARHGLLHEHWSVSHASDFVGYRHATNFSTAFRKRFGVSPKAIATKRA